MPRGTDRAPPADRAEPTDRDGTQKTVVGVASKSDFDWAEQLAAIKGHDLFDKDIVQHHRGAEQALETASNAHTAVYAFAPIRPQ